MLRSTALSSASYECTSAKPRCRFVLHHWEATQLWNSFTGRKCHCAVACRVKASYDHSLSFAPCCTAKQQLITSFNMILVITWLVLCTDRCTAMTWHCSQCFVLFTSLWYPVLMFHWCCFFFLHSCASCTRVVRTVHQHCRKSKDSAIFFILISL